jgi:hypothetical protein
VNQEFTSVLKGVFFPISSDNKFVDSRKVSIMASITIGVLLTETILSRFFDVIGGPLVSPWGILIFAIITVIAYYGGLYLLLAFGKLSQGMHRGSSLLSIMYAVARIAQYAIAAVFLIITMQLVLLSEYNFALIVAGTTISHIPAAILVGLLAYWFFVWYKSNRRDAMVLFLGLSSALAALAIVGNNIVLASLMLDRPLLIESQLDLIEMSSSIEIVNSLFLYMVALPSVVAFVFRWGGTALLLHHFTKKVGKVKYWLIICLPVVSFVVGIMLSLPSSNYTIYDENALIFRIVGHAGATVGYLIMGYAYFVIARSIPRSDGNISSVSNYMSIAGYGTIMNAIAFHAGYALYPPFGLAADWFIASFYLTTVGLYSAVISVSQDSKLRQSIRKFAIEESKLLDSTSMAQIERDMQKKVIGIAKEYQDELSADKQVLPSLTEDDIKEYLREVMDELKRKKRY